MSDDRYPAPGLKRSRTASLLLMGAAPLMLTACGQSQDALVYPSVDACVADKVVSEADCRKGYETALNAHGASAPRYTNRTDCVADFGHEQCAATPSSGGFFMPFMSGFLVAQALNTNRNTNNSNGGGGLVSQPLYRPRTGDWSTAGGYSVGRQTGAVVVNQEAVKPQRAITQSRAGFGSRAAARGSWGG